MSEERNTGRFLSFVIAGLTRQSMLTASTKAFWEYIFAQPRLHFTRHSSMDHRVKPGGDEASSQRAAGRH
jgi:hypothetical protein